MTQITEDKETDASATEGLAQEIRSSEGPDDPVETKLQTSDRVLARITDGIYREPASAIRELIVNAYDADASEVIVQLDPPRFSELRVRDNGKGMSEEELAALIRQIGGSVKRTTKGEKFGTTQEGDPTRSPKGRKLIGKIGIGLFSVAQLTRHFQIITRRKGAGYRLVSDVILNHYSDENLDQVKGDQDIRSGSVKIWRVEAKDESSHGTEIILDSLFPEVRKELQNQNLWAERASGDLSGVDVIPDYHIGKPDPESGEIIEEARALPWSEGSSPSKKMRNLVDSILESGGNPELGSTFDTYLKTLWNVSLAAPLPYVDKHPFDTTGGDRARTYQISSEKGGSAKKLDLSEEETLREHLELEVPQRPEEDKFEVFFDGVKLARPQPFLDMPTTRNALKDPLLFVGRYDTDFGGENPSKSGGPLSFEGYLMWSPKIVPKEHQGVMVRIHDASGTLFDETFMRYQVSEVVRLRQITAEIFVKRGLEPALNIDRESFNFSHPHYQLVSNWLHNALKQVTRVQKRLAREAREQKRREETEEKFRGIDDTANEIIDEAQERHGTTPDYLKFVEEYDEGEGSERNITLPTASFFEGAIDGRKTQQRQKRKKILRRKTEHILTLMAAYGVLDELEEKEINRLGKDISKIIIEEEID